MFFLIIKTLSVVLENFEKTEIKKTLNESYPWPCYIKLLLPFWSISGWSFFFPMNICLCDYILVKVGLCHLCKFIACLFLLTSNHKYYYDIRLLEIQIIMVIILFHNMQSLPNQFKLPPFSQWLRGKMWYHPDSSLS